MSSAIGGGPPGIGGPAPKGVSFGLALTFVVVMLLGGALLLARWMVPGGGGPLVRDMARRSLCGRNVNQIAVAQSNYADAGAYGQKRPPSAFLRGTEGFCRPDDRPLTDAAVRTDASRAFIELAKRSFIDNLAGYACPSDPFVAVLDTTVVKLLQGDRDFPAEGAMVPPQWASPNAAARTETGRTFYSYSMQAGSTDPAVNLSPKMLASIPLASDRNPWSRPLTDLAGVDPIADGQYTGNSWNHNREGQSIALRDGTVWFLPDAREFAMPAGAGGPAVGFDYIFGDGPVSAAPPGTEPAVGQSYIGVGGDQPTRSAPRGCWMFD